MTNVRFNYNDGNLNMTVRGHTGFAEMGKDPVCAGASVLAMTVAQCSLAMYEGGKLQKKPHLIIRNGRVEVTVKPKPEYEAEARHVFYVGEVGMQLLSEAYPKHVELTRG